MTSKWASLNKNLPELPNRPGMSVRRPAQDPSHLTVAEWIIDPGMSFPAHAHDTDRVTYVVYGKLVVTIEGEDVTLDAGSYYYTPSGQITQTKEIIEKTSIIVVAEAEKQPHGHDHGEHGHDHAH
jgi:quercetin dioxygenase-like cupin family protein